MPSKTPAQAKLMRIAAATPGGYGGIPQSVGAEFHAADKAKAKSASHPHKNLGRYLHKSKKGK